MSDSCDPIVCSLPGSPVHGIFQQKYWSELPFPSPGDLLDPEIEPGSPALQADSSLTEPSGKPVCPGQTEEKEKTSLCQ